MAFPSIAGHQSGSATTGNSYSVTLPASIAAGNVLIAMICVQGASAAATFPADWTSFWTGNQSNTHFDAAYRIADGTEGASITVSTTSGNHKAVWDVIRISGNNVSVVPEAGAAAAAGGSSAPNPPSLTPSWGSADTLFLAVVGYLSDARTVSAYPTNYADNQTSIGNDGTTNGCHIAYASRNLTGTSDDPGTFTLSGTTDVIAQTVAIRPVIPTAEFSASQTLDDVTQTATLTDTATFSASHLLDDVTQVATMEYGPAYNEAYARFARGGGEYRRFRVTRGRVRH